MHGQALVEWTVFGLAILGLWVSSMTMARRLLERTTVDTWSQLGVRRALSGLKTTPLEGMRIRLKGHRGKYAQAEVSLGSSTSTASISVPKVKTGFWSSILSLFGFQSSQSSE